jgi:aspartyl-tRNA(Asn)/glutamyl-tRNA(Gln) amidotransferase subunit A
MFDVTSLTLQKASELLSSKQIKAKELTEAFLDRAKNLNKKLNSFITITEDNALKQAEKVDKLIANNQKLPPLAGMPIGVKDLFCTKGIKTTAASKVLENYVPAYDSTVVSKIKNFHAVILGKTNHDAWAHGASGENSDFGPTRNPYDLERVPGGSSSGSAAAVASGQCIAALSTDTGGSTRQPASFCNLVGIKPTYGRVSRYGVVAMASSLDTMGHMTKTVYDNAQILNVTAGNDTNDATSSPRPAEDYTKEIDKGVKGKRIGLPREYFDGLDPKIKSVIKRAAKELENLGAIITDVSLPYTPYGIAAYYIIVPSEISSNLARYDGIRFGNGRDSFGAEAKRRIILGTFTLSSGYYDAYYLKAMKVRRLIRDDFLSAFKNVDAILAPVSPTLPFKLGEKVNDPLTMYLADVYTVNINLAGIPSLAVPAGFIDGLPVGMQVIGPDFSEKLLYQIGYAYEQKTKLYQTKPNI